MGQRGRPRTAGLLTPREQEVLDLIRAGRTNSQIAEALGISVETVKQHVSAVLAKLGVETREEAAAWREEERPRRSFWRLLGAAAGLAIVASAVAGLALLAWGVSQAGTSNDTRALSVAGILPGPVYYLPPEDGSPWISTPDLVAQAGIHVVHSLGQLQTDAVDPVSVIIDKEWWSAVNSDWLSAQESNGVIVVGARIDIAGFGEGYPSDRNYYTMRQRCTYADGNSSSSGQDYLDYQALSHFRSLLVRIRDAAAMVGCPTVTRSADP